MGLFTTAKNFLSGIEEKRQSLFNRQGAIKTKIEELKQEKEDLLASFDPEKPYDPKPIQKLESSIETAQLELDALASYKNKSSDGDYDSRVEEIEKIRQELKNSSATNKEASVKALDKIEEAKKTFLEAQKNYYDIKARNDAEVMEAQDLIKILSSPFNQRVDYLRREQERLGHELYKITPSIGGKASNQSEIDSVQNELNLIRREIVKLEDHKATKYSGGVDSLKTFRNENGATIYFIHDKEQLDAAEKGQIKQ
ncbi:putative nucleic acid-binding Zn-ribbon protein [Alkalihalobacillus xiaoxiensis]|uniref:Nucleic acid-binding Zn-ribbon protein n=1 Tax=Shouchella xiaoxiensis TaxID=766895 RepID=A0ABS2SS71_9BACI|nr:hypothetical protein [Shouchella xiaoxiensis]MBM7838353.1 putative nucleic acid-binding Zn-ribbon protein [Shouchella xiaoxiensis]